MFFQSGADEGMNAGAEIIGGAVTGLLGGIHLGGHERFLRCGLFRCCQNGQARRLPWVGYREYVVAEIR